MSVINTNFLALVSQNNLYRSQSALGSAIARLSSGMRINSAKDDAAGQAIANRFTANIRGLTQAARNANDGISIAQTTEGSLNEVNENLQRIREQVVQALNGSNSGSDLRSIQKEIDERMSEIDRISAETQFNRKYVLGEDGGALTIQVGANDGEQITINLERIDSMVLGLNGFSVAGMANTFDPELVDIDGGALTSVAGEAVPAPTVAAGVVDLDRTSTGAIGDLMTSGGGSYYAEVTGAGSTVNGWYGVTISGNGTATLGTAQSASFDAGALNTVASTATAPTVTNGSVALGGSAAIGALQVSTGGTYYAEVTGGTTGNGWYAVTVTASLGGTATAELTGVASTNAPANIAPATTVAVDVPAVGAGSVDLTVTTTGAVGGLHASAGGTSYYAEVTGASDSVNGWYSVAISVGGTATLGTLASTTMPAGAVAVSTLPGASITISASENVYAYTGTGEDDPAYVIVSGTGSAATYYAADISAGGTVTRGDAFEVGTPATANPLAALDAALQKVDDLRSHLGAIQNRFESTVANLNNTINNLSAARSRIEDADYAVEVSNMTRAQILQQAGTSVLAQANQIPQTVLSLLR